MRLFRPWPVILCLGLAVSVATAGGCGAGSGRPDAAPWMETLVDGLPPARAAAAATLGRTFPEGARGVPLLVAALEDEDPDVRREAEKALESLGGEAADRLAAWLLREWGQGQEEFDRAVTVSLDLGQRYSPQDQAVKLRASPHPGLVIAPHVAPQIFAPHPRFPPYDTWALFEGQAARPATGAPFVRLTAACALSLAGRGMLPLAKRPVPARVLRLASHANGVRRWAALWVLVMSRSVGEDARRAFAALSEDADPLVGYCARQVQEDMGLRPPPPAEDTPPHPGFVEVVIARIESAKRPLHLAHLPDLPRPTDALDPTLRRRLSLALVRHASDGDEGPYLSWVLPWLLAPDAADAEVAAALAERFARILDVSGATLARHPDLLKGIAEEGWPVMAAYTQRYQIVDALGRMGSAAKGAHRVIEPLASSPDLLLRYLARRALRRIEAA